jgi:hypothetical protein
MVPSKARAFQSVGDGFVTIFTIGRVAVFLIGGYLVLMTLSAAVKTFILPRAADVRLTRWIVRGLYLPFRWRADRSRSYQDRDRVMALYGPLILLTQPVVWVALVLFGYTGMYWALGEPGWEQAFRLSGSSLLTLGSVSPGGLAATILTFSEATIGLGLIALLIAYLPAIYTAFSRRETAVAMLEIRAGSPPAATTLIARAHRLGRLNRLTDLWANWEYWFTEIEETHTSLSALVFFRSPQADRSWVTSAGAVLDAAALAASTLDIPRDVQADLCLRSGYLALRRIADFFELPYDKDPKPTDPISISRAEFDAACGDMANQGVPLKQDLDQAWRDYSGWRVNYDTPLIALAGLTMAPYAPWVSDRSLRDLRTPRQPWHQEATGAHPG